MLNCGVLDKYRLPTTDNLLKIKTHAKCKRQEFNISGKDSKTELKGS